jgi:hypothetical protein
VQGDLQGWLLRIESKYGKALNKKRQGRFWPGPAPSSLGTKFVLTLSLYSHIIKTRRNQE